MFVCLVDKIVSAIKVLKGERTIVVIAHRLSTIEHCDRIIELKNGKLVRVLEGKRVNT